MIDGIKADENEEELDQQIVTEQMKQATKSKKSSDMEETKAHQDTKPLNLGKAQSVFVAPHTVKQTGKRMYSPLTNVQKMQQQPDYQRAYVIGICGGPSSGKSSVAKAIKDKIPHAVILNLINFYNPKRGNLRRRSRADSLIEETRNDDDIKSEIREVYRQSDFDTPDAIDWKLLNKGVHSLKNGNPFNLPIYDDETMVRTARTDYIKPSQVIIVEGHLIFCDEELMKQMDLKVFVDTDDDVRLSRKVLKIARKHPGDGAHLGDYLSKYENFIKPSFEKFIEPTKKHADIILPNYGFSTEDKLDIDQMHIPAIDLIIKRVVSENL